MDRLLFVVARDRRDLHGYLTKEFRRDEQVLVVLDRRFAERRRQAAAPLSERRRSSRRTTSSVDEQIRSAGFAVVRPPQASPPS